MKFIGFLATWKYHRDFPVRQLSAAPMVFQGSAKFIGIAVSINAIYELEEW